MTEEIQETALEKLARARKIVRSGNVTKSGENDFAHWKYFELEDFLPQILDALMEVRLTPAPVKFTTETATLILVDPVTKEEIVTTSPMSTANLPGCHAVQNLGAVQTYLRRYLWQSTFEVLETDTLDKTKPKGDAGNKQEQPLPSRPVKVPPRSPQREDSAAEEWKGLIDFDKSKPFQGTTKSGPKAGQPYTLYRITLDDGRTATTFDEEVGTSIKGWDVLHEAMVRVAPNKRKEGTWEWLDIQKVETPELAEDWQ